MAARGRGFRTCSMGRWAAGVPPAFPCAWAAPTRPGAGAGAGGGGGVVEFEHDFRAIRRSGRALLERCDGAATEAGIARSDWTLPHQANGRMDTLCAEMLALPPGRVVNTGRTLGNTGSAAIWLALARHRAAMQPGETLTALGAEATAHMFGGFRYAHA